MALILHRFHLLGHLSSVCSPSVAHIMWSKTFQKLACLKSSADSSSGFVVSEYWSILVGSGVTWCCWEEVAVVMEGDCRRKTWSLWFEQDDIIHPLHQCKHLWFVWGKWYYPPIRLKARPFIKFWQEYSKFNFTYWVRVLRTDVQKLPGSSFIKIGHCNESLMASKDHFSAYTRVWFMKLSEWSWVCPFWKHVLHLSNTNHLGECNKSSSHSSRISLNISAQHHRHLNEM